jgi:hypothetical protein
MTMMTKILAGGAGLAAMAAAAPLSAQYYPGYSYGAPYGNAYGYNAVNTTALAQRCTAAVQQRLSMRGRTGILSILGLGTPSAARVLNVTQVVPRARTVRVRGLATTNAYAAYGPFGVGAYGALGYGAQPVANLSYSCSVDYNGYVRDVDIRRR